MLKKILFGIVLMYSSIVANEIHNYTCEVQNNTCQYKKNIDATNIEDAKFQSFIFFSNKSSCEVIKLDDVNCTENLNENKIEVNNLPSTESSIIFNKREKHTLVNIMYGTDRNLNKNASLENRYGIKRSTLKFGQAQVSIPHTHVFGEIERPYLFQDEKIGRDIVLTHLHKLSQKKFNKFLQNKLSKVEEKDILIFIHGYNVTFASAIRQTAQLTYDLKFKGVPLTYSWTSQGELSQYPKDEVSVQYTIPKLVHFLQEVIKNKGTANIHILAHSMGTRALTNALRDISFLYKTAQFKNVILAAPDIDAEVFKSNLYPYILKTTEKMTLYTSSKDAALEASHTLHDGKRLGEGGTNISVFKNVVTIDASNLDTSFIGLGHSYFSEKKILINDLRAVIQKSLPPSRRSNLIQRTISKLLFWKFKSIE